MLPPTQARFTLSTNIPREGPTLLSVFFLCGEEKKIGILNLPGATVLYQKNMIYVLPEMKLSGLNPNSHIQVSSCSLYIHRIGLPIWLSKIGIPILEIYKSFMRHECGNWETKHYNSVLEITRPHSISGNS